MALMRRTGSSSSTMSTSLSIMSRPRESSAMGFISSLFSSSNSIPSSNTFDPKAVVSKSGKGAVIDWQLNKPEIISVTRLNIHYTSLRDLMLLQCDYSSPIGSEKSPRARMKNHLLEQVAKAYMPLNMERHNKSTQQFFPWNWQKLMSCTPLISFPSTSGWFSGFSLSGALRYLLGRSKHQPPVRFLKHRIC